MTQIAGQLETGTVKISIVGLLASPVLMARVDETVSARGPSSVGRARALSVLEDRADAARALKPALLYNPSVLLYDSPVSDNCSTHLADEGGFDLTPYPAVGAWLERVAAEPGYVPIDA